MHDQPKLCECGCGEPAPIAKKTVRARGVVKGEPVRFIHGHRARLQVQPAWIAEDRGYKTPCWIRQGAPGAGGYGIIKRAGQSYQAHRLAWIDANGAIPDGLNVCHHCDVRLCMNPEHLFLGDQEANMADCVSKGRQSTGEHHPSAKLTRDQVTEIRAATGIRQVDLAAKYGVSQVLISQIRRGAIWRN